MVVAFGAAHREAKKGLSRVLDRVFHPLLATEHLVIADEVTGGAQGVRVLHAAVFLRHQIRFRAVEHLLPTEPVADDEENVLGFERCGLCFRKRS